MGNLIIIVSKRNGLSKRFTNTNLKTFKKEIITLAEINELVIHF